MLTTATLRDAFNAGLTYPDYLATAKPHELENWRAAETRFSLTPQQTSTIASFSRRMPVLVISGTWCGDCVQQCPMLVAIERANPYRINLRFIDRDQHKTLANLVRICDGARVPTVIFMNEDHDFVSLLGDRTLTRYRAMAARHLGPSCPLPGAPIPDDEAAATLQDWVNEFERVALLLRLSPKLRARHDD